MNSIESIPQVWDDERDGQFFHVTASLFTPAYCYGASTLLASYDPDDEFAAAASVADVTPAQPTALETSTSTAKGATR